MEKKMLATLIGVALLLCVAGWSFQTPRAATWEYKQICTVKNQKTLDADNVALNQAGAEGWEMSGATTLFNSVACVYFKRQK